jgi:hypothetical protein
VFAERGIVIPPTGVADTYDVFPEVEATRAFRGSVVRRDDDRWYAIVFLARSRTTTSRREGVLAAESRALLRTKW